MWPEGQPQGLRPSSYPTLSHLPASLQSSSPSRAPGPRQGRGGDRPSQGVLFWACGDRVWGLFLKKIASEPLFIAGGHGHRQEVAGAEAVQACSGGAGGGAIPRPPAPTPPASEEVPVGS